MHFNISRFYQKAISSFYQKAISRVQLKGNSYYMYINVLRKDNLNNLVGKLVITDTTNGKGDVYWCKNYLKDK